MAFKKKTWKDRITEFPTRRTLTKSDGSSELVTVARAEGTVSQEGDSFSAENMNDLETRIGNEFGEINNSLENIDTTFDVLYSTAKEFTTTTYVTITVGNMSGYKKIGFTYANSLDNANIIGNNQYGEIPFGIFKQGIRAYARMNDDCEMYFRYVDNTHVQIRTANISQKVSIKYVFGIK